MELLSVRGHFYGVTGPELRVVPFAVVFKHISSPGTYSYFKATIDMFPMHIYEQRVCIRDIYGSFLSRENWRYVIRHKPHVLGGDVGCLTGNGTMGQIQPIFNFL